MTLVISDTNCLYPPAWNAPYQMHQYNISVDNQENTKATQVYQPKWWWESMLMKTCSFGWFACEKAEDTFKSSFAKLFDEWNLIITMWALDR